MSSPKHIVEIDGRKYDANTGKPLDGKTSPALEYRGRLPHKSASEDIILKVPDRKGELRRLRATRSTRHSEVPSIQRKPDRSHILMRTAVKKPSASASHSTPHRKGRASGPVERVAPNVTGRAIRLRHEKRLHRAKSVAKSPLIKKFSRLRPQALSQTAVTVKTEKLEVRQQHAVPAPAPAPAPRPARQAHRNDWPVAEQFERAMQEANSHLETFIGHPKKHSRKKRRIITTGAALAVLLVLGFGVYTIRPMAEVKLAGNKAGFSPSLPNYSPSGYGMSDNVQANYGEIVLSYQSRTDDKGFKIVQEPSQWNSDSLVSNFLKASNKDYDTLKGGGQSIYTYDKTNATWVDGGIWFKLEGNAQLTNDQLISIAKGL